jgi:hypothetical protein
MGPEPPANGGSFRISIDRSISLGSIIQLVLMIAGGMWMFAQLEASVAAEQEQISALRSDLGNAAGQLRTEFNATITRLDARMDGLRDRQITPAK